jgi:hypothetical protein
MLMETSAEPLPATMTPVQLSGTVIWPLFGITRMPS